MPLNPSRLVRPPGPLCQDLSRGDLALPPSVPICVSILLPHPHLRFIISEGRAPWGLPWDLSPEQIEVQGLMFRPKGKAGGN